MEETLKKLCIKVSEDTNLKTCLEKSLKHRLKGILDAYGVKLPSSAKKHDFSDKAEEIILSEAEAYLQKEGKTVLSFLQDICKESCIYKEESELSDIQPLIERGLVFLAAKGENAVSVVPEEIREIADSDIFLRRGETLDAALEILANKEKANIVEDVSHNISQRVQKIADTNRTEEESEIIKYASALSNMYGIYTPAQLKEVWDLNHRHGISPSDIDEALQKSGDEDGFYILNNKYIANPMLENEEECNELLFGLMAGDSYFFPDIDEIQLYQNSLNQTKSIEYRYMHSYILRKTESEEKTEILMNKLLKAALMDYPPSKLLSLLAEYDVRFVDNEDNDRFTTLYISWLYQLRVWACKGFRPLDLKVEKMQNHNYKLPANIDPRRRKKIGRNDRCPCGSGTKYKNCCGKYAIN